MRVLWLCNIILPEFEPEFPTLSYPFGGWMSGLFRQLVNKSEIELGICMPVYDYFMLKSGTKDNCKYYTFLSGDDVVFWEVMMERFNEILTDFQPDVIHIFGTEYLHASAMAEACEMLSLLDKTVIHIQGLVSVCAKHYYAGIPEEYISLRSGAFPTIEEDRDLFARRGTLEIPLLKKVTHVVGRTDWDKACVTQANPNVNYYFCNEILRDVFYERAGQWALSKCERYSIFVSQASYPIKGLHCLLRALPIVLERHPGTHVYIAGNNPINTEYGMTSYGYYLNDLITQMHLEGYISFLGPLWEAEMAERFLYSNVFVSASSVENTSNSVCEAMLLGVPVVSSYVGGISNVLNDKTDGFFYPYDAEYMLAYYICRIFENAGLAEKISKNATKNMRVITDREINTSRNIEIYKKICS